nr:immunoglobulin heavy chain junction region [Macaca mulatta]MOX91694.1 immunoglobulin heavy chain junction region [Macaca mulatta]MOX91820.1 immunoglobulin heavy chain junction region [Macaca mulatta]MOX92178.1 immunoglobulin heavy chain junction region [Macaca mulatta]MOX92303.1 immunoglobulin heavy chain junction region [Macaca mulatta]
CARVRSLSHTDNRFDVW